jgi:superfamily II DNA or RNA helicase
VTPWPHQVRGVEGVMDAVAAGTRRIVLSSPTGMGKTWMVGALVKRFLGVDKRVLLYTGRRLMLEQLAQDMDAEGLLYGVRAAGHYNEAHHAFQIASLPTDRARSGKDDYQDFPADLVLVDEGHLHVSGAGDRRVLQRHLSRGAVVVYVTATPIGMDGAVDVCVQAGTNSEGRSCGALVPARHFGPDEPAITSKKYRSLADLLEMSEEERTKAVMRPGIFGRVLEWYRKLNKNGKPTLLFAPGVKESRWFAEQFFKAGIAAASIDGEEVWINGERLESTQESRDEVRAGSKDGSIRVVCNRFVLREGANWPWLAHGIFATIFDSLQSYLQAGGRLLRAHDSIRTVVIQDHGGNWRRHGSLNEDRLWQIDLNARDYAAVREDNYRDPDAVEADREPLSCPLCAAVMRRPPCHECGYDFPERERVRQVVQEDGTLVRITGKMFKPKPVHLAPDTAAKWKAIYFRMKNAKKPKTFNQAMAFFYYEHKYRPPRNLPLMPRDPYDWVRPIRVVRYDRLIPDPTFVPGARAGTRRRKAQEKGLFDS